MLASLSGHNPHGAAVVRTFQQQGFIDTVLPPTPHGAIRQWSGVYHVAEHHGRLAKGLLKTAAGKTTLLVGLGPRAGRLPLLPNLHVFGG